MDEAPAGLILADAALAATAWLLAAWLRPWRAVPAAGAPWPWFVQWALLPLAWGLDRWSGMPLGVPLSGASLLVLMAGWPLAMLAMPLSAAVLLGGHLGAAEALQRLAWLGVMPGTLALAWGAAVRRWLPHNPMVYIFGRAYFGTFVAALASGLAGGALAGSDVPLVARVLAAFSEAFLTGMVAATAVAFRPGWLATWADRIYLPPPPPPPPSLPPPAPPAP